MKVKEWLESKGTNEQATFIIAKATKDDNSSFYHTDEIGKEMHSNEI